MAATKQNNKSFRPTSPGVTRTFFFSFSFSFSFSLSLTLSFIVDNVDDRASCLVPQRFRLVASVDVDAALPRGPTLIFQTLAGTYQIKTVTHELCTESRTGYVL
jgi:hypothetical protein